MKFLKAVSVVLFLAAILAILCAVTVTGSGFLDLSNLVRAVCIGAAVVFGLLALIAWKCAETKDKKDTS